MRHRIKILKPIVKPCLTVWILTGMSSAKSDHSKMISYPIVDTAQLRCYDDKVQVAFPQSQAAYSGQDAQYAGNQSSYEVHHNGTVTDRVTGLMWQTDPGEKRTYPQAVQGVSTCQVGGHKDWRLPNAKELQSIVDYSRSPATTQSAAVDPLFQTSRVKEGEENDYAYYWSSTTHKRGGGGSAAVYLSFGKGYGWMTDRRTGKKNLLDVHGAGCQRSDPKSGDPSLTPYGRGPQGDVLRINNYVRCVRGGKASPVTTGPKVEKPSRSSRSSRRSRTDETDGPRAEPPSGGRPRFVNRLDRNKDGKVSKEEFDGPKNHFGHLDQDGDGFISQDEAPAGPPKRR